jgi:capsular polysaccharide export protein
LKLLAFTLSARPTQKNEPRLSWMNLQSAAKTPITRQRIPDRSSPSSAGEFNASPPGEPASSESSVARFARLDALARHRHILMLQGPNGPFFSHLAQRLRSFGAQITKINFNAGDRFFFKDSCAIEYTGVLGDWPDFLSALVATHGFEAIVLFGQWRPHHRDAGNVAARAGLKLYVFEEGYVRPWWITMEPAGVNELSMLAKIEADKLECGTDVEHPVKFRHAFGRMAAYSAAYFAAGIIGSRQYPNYVHHKPFQVSEARRWALAFVRKTIYRVTERKTLKRLLAPCSRDYFLIPLQMGNDSQILHCSPWGSNERFIEVVIESFAWHAKADEMLVFKHHPLECGHADYTHVITHAARRHGVLKRIEYVHGGHLPSLLKRSRGVVLVNSTTGIQAMYHGVPVCATGNAFYARPQLTCQNGMDAFWHKPTPPNRDFFTKFYRFMMQATQINASFYVSNDLVRERSLSAGERPFRMRSLLMRLTLSSISSTLFASWSNLLL